jgi:hypothetical protein
MTTIGIYYRPAIGFVVAADGFSRLGLTAQTRTDVQKIFRVPEAPMVYGVAGSSISAQGAFDLNLQCRNAALSLQNADCRNIQDYSEQFGRKLKSAFDSARPTKDILSYVFLAGYFRDRPSAARICLRSNNHVCDEPTGAYLTELISTGRCLGIGAEKLESYVGQTGHWMERYARPVPSNSTCLGDLVSFAEGFIKACSDSQALLIDPSCRQIGGHIHVAHITPDVFRWAIPPLNPAAALLPELSKTPQIPK